MHRHLGPVGRVGQHRQEGAPALAHPDRLGQLVGLGEQHDEHAERADAEQGADGQAEPGAVLLAVVVADPHQHRAGDEGDEGQEGAAALAQGAAVDHQQGQGEQRQHHRGHGQHPPLRDRHHRPVEAELRLPRGVVHAPVGAHRAFLGGLPRLVEGFDDEVVVALGVEGVDQGAQVDGLVGLGRVGTATHAAVARPAHFRQQQRLLREGLLQVLGALQDELGGVLHRHELPVGQHVGGHQVDVLGQFRVLQPDVPLLGGGHRHLHRGADTVQVIHQVLAADLATEQGLVTHHHANHAAGRVGDFDGLGDLALVAFLVRADPHTQGHPQAEFLGQARDVGQAAVHRVGADVVGLLAQQFEVLADLLVGGVAVLLRVLVRAERREGITGDLFRPVRRGDRTVVKRPDTGEQRSNRHEDHQIESKFTRWHRGQGFRIEELGPIGERPAAGGLSYETGGDRASELPAGANPTPAPNSCIDCNQRGSRMAAPPEGLFAFGARSSRHVAKCRPGWGLFRAPSIGCAR
ncbi:hypothetical protein D9M70_222250 [compost metagenome]